MLASSPSVRPIFNAVPGLPFDVLLLASVVLRAVYRVSASLSVVACGARTLGLVSQPLESEPRTLEVVRGPFTTVRRTLGGVPRPFNAVRRPQFGVLKVLIGVP